MTTRDEMTVLRQLRDAIPPPDPHRRDAARAQLVAALEARDPARRPTISRDSGSRMRTRPAPTRPVVAPTPRARLVGALVPAAVVLVAVVLAWQVHVAVSTPLPFIGRGETVGTVVTVYGDGAISCPNHVADDLSLPVGTVEFQPGPGQIRVIVTLTDAAPGHDYRVELWSDQGCDPGEGPPAGAWAANQALTTDETGAGVVDHVFTGIDPGTHRVNVNLSTEPDPDDHRHREMGGATFTDVVVDSGGSSHG